MVSEEQILAWEREHPRRDFEQYPELAGKGLEWCLTCHAKWPCPFMAMAASHRSLTARLAEVEEAISAEVEAQCDYITVTTKVGLRVIGELATAKSALAKYGRHREGCSDELSVGPCDCGWDLLAAALAPGAGGDGET